MRLTSLNEVRDVRDSLDESYVTTELSEVKLASDIERISVQGTEYYLTNSATRQLCKVLRVPYSFARSLSRDNPDLWDKLSYGLTSQSRRHVTFKVDSDEMSVIGLFPTRTDVISMHEFLRIAEQLYHKIDSMAGVEDMLVDMEDDSSSVFFYTSHRLSFFRGEAEDLFKYGIGFSASSLEMYAPSISESLLRLACSNMSYAPAHTGLTFKSRRIGKIINAIELILDEPERMSRYPEILSTLDTKRLSYRELEDAYSYVTNLEDEEGDKLVPELEARIPLKKIAEIYGYEKPELVPSAPSWKASARTPVAPFDVINHLTEIGSHYTHIPEKERLNLLIYAGGMMFRKNWDLDNIAPVIDLSEWENPENQIVRTP